MYRSNTYDIFSTHKNAVSPQLPHTARCRIKSLQKIKVSRNGLPTDFFLNEKYPREQQKSIKNSKIVTLPNEFDDIRTTPTFLQTDNKRPSQNRQYKSQQRIVSPNKIITNQRTFPIEYRQQITFCNSFFRNQYPKRPKIIDIKIKRKKESEREKKERALMVPHKKDQLTELIKRKHLDKQKYPFLICSRTQPKSKNKLPILKARYPSAFGV